MFACDVRSEKVDKVAGIENIIGYIMSWSIPDQSLPMIAAYYIVLVLYLLYVVHVYAICIFVC